MKKLLILIGLCTLLFAQSHLIYKEEYKDPIHAKIKAIREENVEREQSTTQEILSSMTEDDEKVLFASVEGIEVPGSPDDFKPFFHFPPKHQGLTSSCWAHTGISFIETEVNRLQEKEIKLSVMFIVYWDYFEKARYFVQTRGFYGDLRRGSEVNGVFRIAEQYGLVPEKDFPGNPTSEGFDTELLHQELSSYLNYIKQEDIWDESVVLPTVEALLDKHLGSMPESLNYGGKQYSPELFYNKVLKFNPKKYRLIQSTLAFPFRSYQEFPYPDNWWHGEDCYNVTLDDFYKAILETVKKGISVPITGDTSEPGFHRYAGIGFIPTADIPADYIDQDAREYRINNETTGDDHAVHIVGYLSLNGVDWFLIKDSSRTAYQSSHPGYYYLRGDYIKLKILNAVVPNNLVEK